MDPDPDPAIFFIDLQDANGVSPCLEKFVISLAFSPKPQLLGVKHVIARAFRAKIPKNGSRTSVEQSWKDSRVNNVYNLFNTFSYHGLQN
jgi:hypothetical protein